MVKVIVRPKQVAFHNNVRWREGEEVDLPDALLKDKKLPKWALLASSAEAKAAIEQIKNRDKEQRGKTYAPSTLVTKQTAIPE